MSISSSAFYDDILWWALAMIRTAEMLVDLLRAKVMHGLEVDRRCYHRYALRGNYTAASSLQQRSAQIFDNVAARAWNTSQSVRCCAVKSMTESNVFSTVSVHCTTHRHVEAEYGGIPDIRTKMRWPMSCSSLQLLNLVYLIGLLHSGDGSRTLGSSTVITL